MKKALLKIIIAIIAVITLGITIYSFAADISTYMVIHGNQSYLTTSKSNKEKYIGKTVGIPGNGSDYDLVRNNPRVWCLSEGQINSTGSWLNVSGIIEIGKENNPTYTTIYSDEGTRDNVRGESEVRRAQAAFTMLAGSDKLVDNISGVAQKHFYNTFKDELEDEGLEDFADTSLGSDNSNKTLTRNGVTYTYHSYSTAITNLNKPLKDNTYKDLVNESYSIGKKDTHYKSGNEKYYYACISSAVTENVLDFSTNSTLVTSRKVIITSDSGKKTYTLKLEKCSDNACSKHWYLYNSSNQLSGRITMKGNIYLYEQEYKPGNNIKSVEIKVEFDYIHAILYMLGGTATQTRGVSLGEWLKGNLSSGAINVKENKTQADISMQKYITKVESGENSQDFNDSRANARSSESESSDKHVTTSGSKKTYKNISKNNNVKENYKYNEKVSIEVGDKVTYRIYVYNNKNNSVSGITLTDRLPYYYTTEDTKFNTGAKATAVKVISVKDNDGKDVSYTTAEESDSKCELLKIQNITLEGNQEKYYDIVLEFNQSFAGVYTNTAWVSCNGNTTDYRLVDRDYVEMQKYSVALEKFVSKVNGEDIKVQYDARYDINGDNKLDYADVETISDYLNGKIELSEEQKIKANVNTRDGITSVDALALAQKLERENHPIYKEGDTLKKDNPVLVERGDKVTYTIKLINTGDTVIKVTEIEDNFDENIKFVKAEGYGKPSAEEKDGKLIITITNPEEIPAKESRELTLEFEVIGNSDKELINTAEVTKITNKNGTDVTDSDGDKNNEDSDWIKLKKHAVSLEKFITEVNGKPLPEKVSDREGKAEYLTDGTYVNETEKDSKWTQHNTYKQDNVVTVSNGDRVTYTIKVRNDGETSVYVKEIADVFPQGVSYGEIKGDGETEVIFKDLEGKLIPPGGTETISVTVIVTEPANSTKPYLKNTARIKTIADSKDNVEDSSPFDNEDSDYINVNFPGEDPTYTSCSVEKVWADKDNKYGKRPTSVTVELYRNGTEKIDTVELNSANNWKHEWPKLDEKDKDGKIYQYLVKEIPVPEYTTTYETIGNKTIITNTYNEGGDKPTPEDIDIKVQKYWIGDKESDRPLSIKVELYENGTKKVDEAILTKDNNWSHTWKGYNNEHTYTVEEVDVPKGYTVNINGYSVYNTYIGTSKEETSYSVEKVWADNNDIAGKRPESVTVKLYRVGETKPLKEVKLNSENNWQYEWTGLDKYDENKNEYQYYALEDEEKIRKKGYEPSYTPSPNKTTIKNTYNGGEKPTPEYVDITVRKYWEDDKEQNDHDPITVNLIKNGTEKIRTVVLNKDNNWSHEWEGLEKGFIYHVEEENVPEGYTVSVNGYTIINKYNQDSDPDPDPTPDEPGNSIISGFVWNDISQSKIQNNYDGRYQTESTGNLAGEEPLKGITVSLYREGYGIVATDITDSNGYYSFNDASLKDNEALLDKAKGIDGRYIKGPKEYKEGTGTTTWTGEYYSYYVIFEYDGVMYTSTLYNNFKSTDNKDSNASEENNITKSRNEFNTDFEKYRDNGEVEYYTINKSGRIPQSRHNSYDKDVLKDEYKMYSTTELISMESFKMQEDIETLKHINLGLRGRDIFDLELTSEVEQIKVKVNNVDGVYKYTDNVNLRRSDFNIIPDEDMAHVKSETNNSDKYYNTNNQYIRNSDKGSLNEIIVKYKITVYNASNTVGTATKIINYYDSNYEFYGCSIDDYKVNSDNVVIELPENEMLVQGQSLDLYIEYKLKSIPEKGYTYNMSEILEYKIKNYSKTDEKQKEFTRGLIDKDSAPGSANKEQVRTIDTEEKRTPTKGGNPTTVGYYFKGDNLDKLKYEDDTYGTEVKYTMADSIRKIEGFVFEDLTQVHPTSRIKTGNGKLDEGREVGIFGVTVTLQGPTSKTTTTNADGWFEFKDILPGEYTIKYEYGHNSETVLLGQLDEDTNKESYNGEDYQATNNIKKIDGMDTNVLNGTDRFWYVYNEMEKISTATDDEGRRNEVSHEVIAFNTDQMGVLNSIRELIGTYSDRDNGTLTAEKKWDDEKNNIIACNETITGVNDIINKTSMFASTEKLLVTVEETVEIAKLENSSEILENNLIIEKLDARGNKTGLAEWCIFPGTNENGYYPNYEIKNMNFGLAKVPVTVVDLQKYVSGFTITDSTGNNKIASMRLVKAEGEFEHWEREGKGDVMPVSESNLGNKIDPYYSVSIEDEKLQGARLEITYTISQNLVKEVNFDDKDVKVGGTIKGIVDFIDNNLSYNPLLGENDKYWEVITYDQLINDVNNLGKVYEKLGKTIPTTSIPEKTDYNTIIRLKESSGFFNVGEGSKDATVTLEKVLASTNATIDEILGSVLDDYRYGNTIRITNWEYSNTESTPGVDVDPTKGIDRIRTPEGYIILPGIQHDSEIAEIIVIHPPTGSGSISIIYLLIAAISLTILAAGVFAIKKYVIKK